MLGVKADLECEHGCAVDAVRRDQLRFVVLAWRLLGAEPDLDARTAGAVAEVAQFRRHQAPDCLGHHVEERQVHDSSMACTRHHRSLRSAKRKRVQVNVSTL
jgi:hypothetical protein